MKWELLKKDIKNFKKKLGFFEEKEGFMQRNKDEEEFFFKEGEIVTHKLNKKSFLVKKNLKKNFFEPRKRCEVKTKEGEILIFYEHELMKEENNKPKNIGFNNFFS